MLLEVMMGMFFQEHYLESTFEIKNRREEHYIDVVVDAEDEYFSCSFHLLDSATKKFTVHCDQNPTKSFAFAVDDNKLVDIKRDLFTAREILNHLDAYFEEPDGVDEFLSSPNNLDFFYAKISFYKSYYGNEWSIELNPMYEEMRLDDIFLSMGGVGMIWNASESKFDIYNGHELITESSIDYTNGIISINRKILIFILNPDAKFGLVQYISDENPQELLIYEGEIGVGGSETRKNVYSKFTISNLEQLPVTDIVVELGDRKIEAKTPLLLINDNENGFFHFTLNQYDERNAIDEVIDIVKNNITGVSVQTYIDHLEEIRSEG